MNRTVIFLVLSACCLLVQGASCATGDTYWTPVSANPGFFLVTSVPPGGSVSFDGIMTGTTPVQVPVDPSGPAGHVISITRSGYQVWMQQFPGNPGPGETIVVTADLKPEVLAGNIQVTTSPLDSIASLDGRESRTTPALFTGVSPGYHTIIVRKDGFLPYSTTVGVEAGKVIDIQANLTDLSTTGTLELDSLPIGAELSVDGTRSGMTPWSGRLSPGNHTLTLRREGYLPWEGYTLIRSGETTHLNPALIPSADSGIGVIAVQSNPPGAMIYLDGEYRGETTAGGAVNLPEIPRGPHTLLLRHSGYADFTQLVTVYAGQMTHMTADLLPSSQAASMTGTLEIRSIPAGAMVTVDASPRGTTPVTVRDLSPGNHTITLSAGGFLTWNGSTTISPGRTAMVDATLEPVPATPQKQPVAPALVLSALFISLSIAGRCRSRGRT